MNQRPLSVPFLALLLSLLLCGCIAYRPRLLKYDDTGPAALASGTFAKVTVSGEGALIQLRERDPWRPLRSGESVSVGSLLMTHGDSELIVELPDGQGQVRIANGSTVELARLDRQQGTLLVLAAGKVSGSVSGAPLELISPSGGSLTLNPEPGATVPFNFNHGRDAYYYELARRLHLGLETDWGPLRSGSAGSDLDLFVFRSPRGNVIAVPEPAPWTLLLAGGLGVGLIAFRRR